jgi:hypothetical protein
VKQFILQKKAMPDEVKELYSKYNNSQCSLSLDEYAKILLYLLNYFQKFFIIVDALNEHLNEEEKGLPSQMKLLRRSWEFQLQSNATIYY